MSGLEGLPDSRTSLVGRDDEGHEVWLIRSIAGKLYRCPGCHAEVEIGTEHVVVHYVRRLGGTDHHHWHRACAEGMLIPELLGLRRVKASESSQGRIVERGRQRPKRRKRV
jgi:hypothetical protein